jgi:hypothetical protein
MPSFRFRGCPVIAASLLLILAFLSCPLGAQSRENDKAPAANRDQAQFNLHVSSNLVVVRVVVRDAQGKPIGGLQKSDFQLYDRGTPDGSILKRSKDSVDSRFTPEHPALETSFCRSLT